MMDRILSGGRSRMPRGTAGVLRMALLLSLLVLAGCGSSHASRSSRRSRGARSASAQSGGDGRVLLRGLEDPEAYAAGGSLYVAHEVTPPADAHTAVISELMRVSPISGRILAIRRLGSMFDQALFVDGELWVTSTPLAVSGSVTWLWRLDPTSLAARSRTILPGPGRNTTEGSMAVAGGQLWVATKTLSAVSLSSGQARQTTGVIYPGGMQIAADPAGRTLLASVGSEHPTRIERLDPNTGATLAESGSFWSVTKPLIGGISNGGAWVSDATGMAGSFFRLDVNTLKITHTQGPAVMIATNGIRAQVIDGILWVTQPAGGSPRNYCGDPVTGSRRAPLPLSGDSLFLTADTTSFYYEPLETSPAEIVRAPIDPRCSPVLTATHQQKSDQPAARTLRARSNPPLCGPGDVGLSVGSQSESATGEHDDLLVITNRSSRSCGLDGYPHVSLSDRGKHLAFVYAHGGWPYVTLRKPQHMTLTPGDHAYILIAKYRCDGRVLHPARLIHISIPGTAGSITTELRRPGVYELDYCQKYPGDQRVDPGNRVTVSPIEATIDAALAPPI
jgi:Protein of unknown function (DUF4232)